MNEENSRVLPVAQLPDRTRENIVNLLKEEGLSDHFIERLRLTERSFKNPHGLNKILFDVQGLIIGDDDWDKKIPRSMYIGKLEDSQARGRMRQLWGTILQKQAFLYLKKRLAPSGWKLKSGLKLNGREYDCLGWKKESTCKHDPDLAIEMYFPRPPQARVNENLQYIAEHPREMVEKLRKINAKHKYILIGVPQNKIITTLEIPQSDVNVVYQRHRFDKIVLAKQRVLSHE